MVSKNFAKLLQSFCLYEEFIWNDNQKKGEVHFYIWLCVEKKIWFVKSESERSVEFTFC